MKSLGMMIAVLVGILLSSQSAMAQQSGNGKPDPAKKKLIEKKKAEAKKGMEQKKKKMEAHKKAHQEGKCKCKKGDPKKGKPKKKKPSKD